MSRYSAAKPSRAGENYARAHHGETDADSTKVTFDVRNPSALAPDAAEEDAVLEADVIGGTGGTKRGAVNLDGYDSDSDNDNIDARAEERHRNKKGGGVDIRKQFDDYGAGPPAAAANSKGKAPADEDEDEDDMFAGGDDDDEDEDGGAKKATGPLISGKKSKEVRFLDNSKIQGQDMESRSGGRVRLYEDESSDDEEDRELAVAEEDVDAEVGLGGLKRNAPKIEAFNMKQEQEEGRFDQDGNYIRKAADPDAVHDRWLEGLSKRQIRLAAEAHERREAEARRQRTAEDNLLTPDLLKALIVRLERGETPLEALARLGKGQKKPKSKAKKVPAWKLKKLGGAAAAAGEMDVDGAGTKAPDEDPAQRRISEAIEAITDAADKLLGRDHAEIYDQERELLVREWQRETGDRWEEPAREAEASGDVDDDGGAATTKAPAKMWEFRWTDGRDGAAKQGPFETSMMKAWEDAGYFGGGVEFRPVGDEGWSRVAHFG